MTEFSLRGQTYKIENASDILAEELIILLQQGLGDRSGRARVAEVISSACPSIDPKLIQYRSVTHVDGSNEERFVMALDVDEIAVFAKYMTLAMLEQRQERLRTVEVDESRKDEVKQTLAKLDEGIPQFKKQLENVQIDILLRTIVTTEQSAIAEQPRAAMAIAKPVEKKNKGFLKEVSAISPSRVKIQELEAQLSALKTAGSLDDDFED